MLGSKLILACIPLVTACATGQMGFTGFGSSEPVPQVTLGNARFDTVELTPETKKILTIPFAAPCNWNGDVWVTQEGAAARVQWKKAERVTGLKDSEWCGWQFQMQYVPTFIGQVKLKLEPDGYPSGESQFTIHVVGPLRSF